MHFNDQKHFKKFQHTWKDSLVRRFQSLHSFICFLQDTVSIFTPLSNVQQIKQSSPNMDSRLCHLAPFHFVSKHEILVLSCPSTRHSLTVLSLCWIQSLPAFQTKLNPCKTDGGHEETWPDQQKNNDKDKCKDKDKDNDNFHFHFTVKPNLVVVEI